MIETINNLSQTWWTWTAGMLWQVGILILIVGCLDILLRRWAWPHMRYALWLMVLVKLVLPPGIHMSSSLTARVQPQVSYWILPATDETVGQDARAQAVNAKGYVPTPTAMADARALASSNPALAPIVPAPAPAVSASDTSWSLAHAVPLRVSLTWQSWIMVGWLAGIAILAIWLIRRLRYLRHEDLTLAAQAQLPESFYLMAQRCAEQIGLAHCPRIIITDRIVVPAVTGMFRPVLLMPAGFLAQLHRKDAEHMLLHEFAHIKRGDLIVHGIYMMLQVVYWYNPLLWLASRQMHHLRELCCDATVARHLRERALEYRQTLLDIARRYLARSVEPGLGLLGLFEDSNRLAVRLNWLKKKTWRYQRTRTLLIAALVIAMGLCVLPMAQAQDQTSSATPAVSAADVSEQENTLLQELEALRQQQQTLTEQLEQLKQKKSELAAATEKPEANTKTEDEVGSSESVRFDEWTTHFEEKVEDFGTWLNSPETQKLIKDKGSKWAKQWTSSPEFKQWQKDLQVWNHDMKKLAQQKWQGLTTDLPTAPPMPPLPDMPKISKPLKPMPKPVPVVAPKIKGSNTEGLTLVKEVTYAISPSDPIEMQVKNPMGAIRIRGDKDTTQIKVLIKTQAKSQEQAKALADLVVIQGKNQGRTFNIKAQPLPQDGWNNVKVDFEIMVPAQVESIKLQSELGMITATDIEGRVDATTQIGAIQLQGVHGCMDLVSEVGSINVILPCEISAKVEAEVKTGTLETDFDLPINHSGMGAKLKGKLGDGEHEIKMQSQTGSIAIRSQAKQEKQSVCTTGISLATAGEACSSTSPKEAPASGTASRTVTSIEDYKTDKGHAVKREETHVLPLKPGQRLKIINGDGDVTIRGEDRQDGHLVAILTLEASGKPCAQRLSKQVNLEVVQQKDGLVLQAVMPDKLPKGNQVRIDLTLTLPQNTPLEMIHEDGDITVQGISSPAKLIHEDGDVVYQNMGQSLDITHEDGDVVLQKIGSSVKMQLEDGDVVCQQVGGQMMIHREDGDLSLRQIGGAVKVEQEDGDVVCQQVGGKLELTHEDGHVEIQQVGGSVEMEHEDGQVAIQGIGGSVTIAAADGPLTCHNIAGSLDASQEDGKIHVEAVAGTVTLAHEMGDIICRRITGALAIKHEEGRVDIDRLTGPLTLKMETGDVSCDNLGSHAKIRLAEGNVILNYQGKVSPECNIDVQVDEGRIQLAGTDTLLGTANPTPVQRKEEGAEWQTVVETERGQHSIKLRTADGSILVSKR
ncbi:M56 family metallopeptidase [Planctomycetota bacterium]